MAQIGSPEEARRIVNYWADEGVTWFKAYTDISREALGAAIEAAHARGLKFTGPPLLGLLPRGGRAGDRQSRARAVHQQRLCRRTARRITARGHARQPAQGGDRRPRGAADDPRDGRQQGGDDVDAGGLRAVVSRSPAARGAGARRARSRGARGVSRARARRRRRAPRSRRCRSCSVGRRRSSARSSRPADCSELASIPPAWAARFQATAISATTNC